MGNGKRACDEHCLPKQWMLRLPVDARLKKEVLFSKDSLKLYLVERCNRNSTQKLY